MVEGDGFFFRHELRLKDARSLECVWGVISVGQGIGWVLGGSIPGIVGLVGIA